MGEKASLRHWKQLLPLVKMLGWKTQRSKICNWKLKSPQWIKPSNKFMLWITG